VHPTTRLLQPFRGSDQLPPGILAISSRGVKLCTCLGRTLDQQQHAGLAVDEVHHVSEGLRVQLLDVVMWELAGLPLSCVALSDCCYLVGDNRSGEHGIYG
jgi:hypothetical protein